MSKSPLHPPDPLLEHGRRAAEIEADEAGTAELGATLCPHCGGRLRVIADVTDPVVIRKILDHIHQRAPPVERPTPKRHAISEVRG